jgi:hypothetical protein
MKKVRRLAVFLAGGMVLLLILFIVFLEIGSRVYQCPYTAQCPIILVCDPSFYLIDEEKGRLMQDLIESRGLDIDPSTEDLERVMTVAPEKDMAGVNGVACGGGIFVRESLGREGRRFVARHELEHIFQQNGFGGNCSKWEFCATLVAAMAYPQGFVETVISSLVISLKESPTFWCFLFGSWEIFKAYLLP